MAFWCERGAKQTKKRVIVNNKCKACIEKTGTTNADQNSSGEDTAFEINDDEPLNNISFRVFKSWLENKFMKRVTDVMKTEVKVIVDGINNVKAELKKTKDNLDVANKTIENLRQELDGNVKVTNQQKVISDNNLKHLINFDRNTRRSLFAC